MKTIILPAAIILLVCFCSSCGTTKYIPVESTKIEYRDQLVRDSVFRYDSIFVKQKSDTIFFERYRYLYNDKIIRDSIFIQDTIQVPYPVEVVKHVKAPLTGWQNFQVWCGRMVLVGVLFLLINFVLKLKKILPF